MSRLDDITAYAASHYLTLLNNLHGQVGIDIAKRLHPALKRIYSAIDYASISGSLTVFPSGLHDRPIGTSPQRLFDYRELALHNHGTLTIEVISDDEYLVWHEEVAPEVLAEVSLLYKYSELGGGRVSG